MSAYQIDLNAKYVKDNTRIWRIFPGFRYSFLDRFLEQSAVFLDFPGLLLPDGAVTRGEPSLQSRIIHSRTVNAWITETLKHQREDQPNPGPGRPSDDLVNYLDAASYDGLPSDIGILVALFGSIPKGDFVIVPDHGRSRQVYIGEFLTEPTKRKVISLGEEFVNESTFGREVRWFPVVSEIRLPFELLKPLRTQNTLIQISNQFLNTICDVTYGTYYNEKNFASVIKTLDEYFSGQDALDISLMVKYAAKAAADFRDGKRQVSGIEEVIEFILDENDELSVSININSPGFLNARSSYFAPLVLSAFMALFLHGDAAAKPTSLQVINSMAPLEDKCTAEVSQLVIDKLDAIGLDEWISNCKRAQRLRRGPKVEVESRVRKQ